MDYQPHIERRYYPACEECLLQTRRVIPAPYRCDDCDADYCRAHYVTSPHTRAVAEFGQAVADDSQHPEVQHAVTYMPLGYPAAYIEGMIADGYGPRPDQVVRLDVVVADTPPAQPDCEASNASE